MTEGKKVLAMLPCFVALTPPVHAVQKSQAKQTQEKLEQGFSQEIEGVINFYICSKNDISALMPRMLRALPAKLIYITTLEAPH